jgi:hypothetical protein
LLAPTTHRRAKSFTAAVIRRFPGFLHSGTGVGSTGGSQRIPGMGAT